MIPLRLSFGQWSPVIRRLEGELGKGAVALTFDDGPEPSSTPALIAALKAAGAKGSFFLCGIRAERHPELVQALVAEGHDIYAHGWDHRRYADGEAEDATAAMARTEALLQRHRPTPGTYLLRLPYNAGLRSPAMHRALRQFHPDAQFAWWSHAVADYSIAAEERPEAEIRQACSDAVARVAARPDLEGGILLLHDAAITEPLGPAALTTRILLPELLQRLKLRGLRGIALPPRTTATALARFAFRSPEPYTVRPEFTARPRASTPSAAAEMA